MREKLIKLLRDGVRCPGVIDSCWDCPNYTVSQTCDEFGATVDMLIANGVTMPTRCKDCQFWTDGVAGCTDHVKLCKIGFYMVGENGYCVFGERKGNEV